MADMTVRRGELLVPLERNAVETFLLELCVLSGTGGIFGFGPPPSDNLPPWLRLSWYVLLVLGGLTCVVGILLRDAIMGLAIERAGLVPVAGGATIYGVLVLVRGGATAYSSVIIGLFVAHAIWRIVQVSRLLRGHITRVG